MSFATILKETKIPHTETGIPVSETGFFFSVDNQEFFAELIGTESKKL